MAETRTKVMDQFSKSFKATNFSTDPQLGNGPKVVEIASAHVIDIKNDERTREVCKITFKDLNRYWLAGKGEALPMLIEVLGTDIIEEWIGKRIELYMDVTDIGGEPGPCIRPRPVDGETPKSTDAPKTKKLKRPKSNDEPDGYPMSVGECADGDIRIQFKEFGSHYELPPDLAKDVLAGNVSQEEVDAMMEQQ